jgi:predicted dehydrogenase
MYLHLGHSCGAHTMIEISFSYNATSREPRSHFQYELIGTDGVIRMNREEHSFELRNSHGTQWLAWHPEKNFAGMHAEFLHFLNTGDPHNLPTAEDGLLATRIARSATELAIRDRELCSAEHRSTLARATGGGSERATTPMDSSEADDAPASILSTLFEPTRK